MCLAASDDVDADGGQDVEGGPAEGLVVRGNAVPVDEYARSRDGRAGDDGVGEDADVGGDAGELYGLRIQIPEIIAELEAAEPGLVEYPASFRKRRDAGVDLATRGSRHAVLHRDVLPFAGLLVIRGGVHVAGEADDVPAGKVFANTGFQSGGYGIGRRGSHGPRDEVYLVIDHTEDSAHATRENGRVYASFSSFTTEWTAW